MRFASAVRSCDEHAHKAQRKHAHTIRKDVHTGASSSCHASVGQSGNHLMCLWQGGERRKERPNGGVVRVSHGKKRRAELQRWNMPASGRGMLCGALRRQLVRARHRAAAAAPERRAPPPAAAAATEGRGGVRE
eukprot:1897662-Pleurochrysis_carterae.AAC.1